MDENGVFSYVGGAPEQRKAHQDEGSILRRKRAERSANRSVEREEDRSSRSERAEDDSEEASVKLAIVPRKKRKIVGSGSSGEREGSAGGRSTKRIVSNTPSQQLEANDSIDEWTDNVGRPSGTGEREDDEVSDRVIATPNVVARPPKPIDREDGASTEKTVGVGGTPKMDRSGDPNASEKDQPKRSERQPDGPDGGTSTSPVTPDTPLRCGELTQSDQGESSASERQHDAPGGDDATTMAVPDAPVIRVDVENQALPEAVEPSASCSTDRNGGTSLGRRNRAPETVVGGEGTAPAGKSDVSSGTRLHPGDDEVRYDAQALGPPSISGADNAGISSNAPKDRESAREIEILLDAARASFWEAYDVQEARRSRYRYLNERYMMASYGP